VSKSLVRSEHHPTLALRIGRLSASKSVSIYITFPMYLDIYTMSRYIEKVIHLGKTKMSFNLKLRESRRQWHH
jgi:hypothetical protein